jgi:predicted double-glycine peptidase
MIRLLALFILGGFIIVLIGCAGVSEVKKGTDPATSVTVRTAFGGYITKHVVSARELRYKGMVPQKYDFSCGAASMATMLKYLYDVQDVKEEEIAKEMIEKGDQKKIREKGFSLLDMKKYAERHGLQANGYKVKSENLEKLKIPAIVLLTTRGYKHFVILKGIRGQKAYLADPAIGNRSVSLNDFLKSWDGVVFLVYKKMDKELTLPLNEALRSRADNILNLQNLGFRNYIGLPGEF